MFLVTVLLVKFNLGPKSDLSKSARTQTTLFPF